MTIQAGERLPAGKFRVMGKDGPQELSSDALFAGKRVVLFAVPGAFTPTCSARHLPGFLELADQLRARGVDTIACLAVNDVFVMNAWGKSAGVADQIVMLADGNGDFVRALGLELDARGSGMGQRARRFAIVAQDGVVQQLHVEAPGEFKVSSAQHVLTQL
jgi:peroxiredoxin